MISKVNIELWGVLKWGLRGNFCSYGKLLTITLRSMKIDDYQSSQIMAMYNE